MAWRRQLPGATAAFFGGFLIALVIAAIYVQLITAGGGSTPVVLADSTVVQTDGSGNGEIAVAHRDIMNRLTAKPIPTRRMQGDISLRVANVVWNDGRRRPFLRAQAMRGVINVAAAERGDIIVDRVVVTRADVLLDQPQAGGEWNYERVLRDLLEDENGNGDLHGPRKTIAFTDVELVDSRVEIHQPTQDIALEDLDAKAMRIELSSPRSDIPELNISTATTVYVDLRKHERIAVRADDARIRLPKDQVDFKVARARLGTASLAMLEGTWRPGGEGLGLTIAGRANDVALEELAFFSDRLPKTGRASFNFAVRPLGGEAMEVRLSNADINADGSRVRGAFAVRTGGEQFELISVDARLEPLTLALVERMSGRTLPYGGSVSGTVRGTEGNLHFEVTTALTATGVHRPLEMKLDGAVAIVNGTFELRRLQADLKDVPAEALRPLMPGLPFTGNISGTIALSGPPDRAPLTVSVRLDLAGGVALVNGTVDLTGAEPSYDLNGRLIGVSLEQLLEPRAPPAAITARFALRGRGVKPETADAQVNVVGGFSGWRDEPDDTLQIAARIRNGAVAVDTSVVFLGPVHLHTRGEWRFVAPETGALTYQLAVDNVAPLAEYIPAIPDTASGGLEGNGTISGSLQRTRIEGTVEGTELHLGDWAVSSVAAKHTFVIGDSVPEIHVEGNARGISTPSAGAYSVATLNLHLAAPAFQLDLKADRVEGGIIEVAATGHIPNEGARRVELQRARLDLGTGQWALVQPASVEWGRPGGGVDVRNLDFRAANGPGRLRVDGRVMPLAQFDARIETAALPLEELQVLMGRQPLVTGALTANADVRGPGTAPTFDVQFQLDTGRYQGVGFRRIEGKLNYAGQVLTADAVATFDTIGALDLKASLPMNVALSPEIDFDLLDAGPVSGSLTADSVALIAFSDFFPQLLDVQGALRANATLSGTAGSPVLAGQLTVVGGAATIVPLQRRYTNITADIAFDQRGAEVRSVRAVSGGTLDVTGRIDFPDLNNPVSNLTVKLNRFQPAGVDDHPDAFAVGELRITGPLLAPTVSGGVTLEDGDVAVPEMGGGALDTEFAQLGSPIEMEDPGASGDGTMFDKIRLDNLRISAGDRLWFTMPNARAELRGDLTVNKDGPDLRITGTLEGERGTYTLEAGPILRRFQIVHVQVRFLGGPDLNPALDITARRVVIDPTGREMEIDVRVGGTLETPTLSLASQDAAQIPQSELLSVLLFGEPTLGLGSSELPGSALIEETFFSGFAELASLELEDALGAPFDIFQIRLGGGRLGGLGSPILVLGREVTEDVFLTVESGIAALFGPDDNSAVNANTWAIRLEWRIDRRTSLRAGYEPVNRAGLIRRIGVALPVTRPQQVGVELRKRWVW
ncbi:MAG: translocation/assembly module TamB domain-containing protein [Gemmatimonadota bacterium]